MVAHSCHVTKNLESANFLKSYIVFTLQKFTKFCTLAICFFDLCI